MKNNSNKENNINKIPGKDSEEKQEEEKIIVEGNGIKTEYEEKNLFKMFLKISKFNDAELNLFSYKKAVNLDKRSYNRYYFSLIKTKHLLFFSFMPAFDYNSQILKKFLFFFNFAVNFVVNALFFNDDTMHKIYTDGGEFNFIYNIPQIIISSLISGFITAIINLLALSDDNFIQLRYESTRKDIRLKSKEMVRLIQIKFGFFFLINLCLLGIFWFYLGCFCAVYKNTQIHLIKDTLFSFGSSMIYPFALYLIPGIFRIYSLRRKKKIIYGFSKFLQLIN